MCLLLRAYCVPGIALIRHNLNPHRQLTVLLEEQNYGARNSTVHVTILLLT